MLRTATLLASLLLVSAFGTSAGAFPAPAPVAAAKSLVQTPAQTNLAEEAKQPHSGSTSQPPSGS